MYQIEILKSDFPEMPGYKYFDFPEYKIEILLCISSDAKIFIYSSFCPHFGGKLSIKNNSLFCPFHDYKFDINNGECINKNNGLKCMRYDFFENQDSILIPLE